MCSGSGEGSYSRLIDCMSLKSRLESNTEEEDIEPLLSTKLCVYLGRPRPVVVWLGPCMRFMVFVVQRVPLNESAVSIGLK